MAARERDDRPAARGILSRLGTGARRGILGLGRRAERRAAADTPLYLDYFHATGLDALHPLTAGNRVRLFSSGTRAFRAMEGAIFRARTTIDYEVYIFAADDCGERILSLLVAARRRGVDVHLLVDAVGSLETPDEFFDPLVSLGGRVERFNPIFGWHRKRWHPNERDHRKILVIDGRVAFVGGMNVDARNAGDHETDPEAWRDTQARVEGPVVSAIQDLFVDHFEWETGERLDRPESGDLDAEDEPLPGTSRARVVGGEPGTKIGPIRRAYVFALRRAARRAFFTTSYFVPPRSFLRALKRAARRGVDVRLLLPGRTDHRFVMRAGQSFYAQLLRAGVRIFEWTRSPLHAKTAVVDDAWSVVGSANLDVRSFEINYEADLHCLGGRVGPMMTALFLRDAASAREILLPDWERRSLLRRLVEKFCALFRRFL